MKRKIQIMLVEDSPEYRNVIALALDRDPEMELISNVGTAERALSNLQDMAPAKVPDLILLDLTLPGMSGIDALPLFAQTIPDTRIMILTQSDSEADVMNAISLGAAGYLLKSTAIRQITDGIRTVMAGGASLDPSVARYILNSLQSKAEKLALECALT